MNVVFQFYDAELSARPHIPVSFTRDVDTLPRVGDHIVQHSGTSRTFVVREVTHVFEDRSWYKERFGDRIVVTMQQLSWEESNTVFQELVEKAASARVVPDDAT